MVSNQRIGFLRSRRTLSDNKTALGLDLYGDAGVAQRELREVKKIAKSEFTGRLVASVAEVAEVIARAAHPI
jgi:hypothetical protein